MDSELLSVSIKGEGEAVIILHGLFGSSDNLSRVATELEKDYQVFRVDLRNHGNSFHHTEMNYSVMVEDINNSMRHYEVDSANFIGHSMGGKVAMAFALSYPEKVQKLIVADIAPVTYPLHHNAILRGLSALPLETISNRKEADEYLAGYIEEQGIRQFLLKSLDFARKQLPVWKFNLSAILNNYDRILQGMESSQPFNGKTLFVAGGKSDYIKSEYQQKTMALFPKAKLKIIPEASHWLHAEKPRVFISICQRFLEEKINKGD
jgi:esterase